MFAFIIRALITIVGIIFGNLLVYLLEEYRIFDLLFSNFLNDSILMSSVYFGIVFCVSGVFFLASSVIFDKIDELHKKYNKNKVTSKTLAEILALILGLTVSLLLMPILNYVSPAENFFSRMIFLILYLLICVIITKFSVNSIYGFLKANASNIGIEVNAEHQDLNHRLPKQFMVDTNIFIDGRILSLAENNILTATLCVPDFVLNELQYIADSEEDLMRRKGRRGLDVLNKLKELNKIEIKILDTNKSGKVNVDSLLIKLAKQIGAGIISNDLNLCQIAKIKNLDVININSLAIALKPDLIQGDKLTVKPVKKGKAKHQGIAYLDDGTMIVIENAEFMIGTEIEVEVTESLQSSQGKMIFTKPIEDSDAE